MVEVIKNVKTYDGKAYFEDWLEGRGYGVSDVNELREDLLYRQDVEVEDLEEEVDKIEQEFYSWCEENNLEPEIA